MVFPGAGVMQRREILESLRSAPRWNDVDISSCAVATNASDVIVVEYHA